MDQHRDVAERVASELAARSDVLAVLLTGSVARSEHEATSDIDLSIVATDDATLRGSRRNVDGLLVECGVFTEAGWLARFDRPKTSWLYTFLEAETLMDTGAGARIVDAARQLLATYRTSSELRRLLATFLWHCQAKLDRAQADTNPRELGFWAAFCTGAVLDGLYAMHDVPLPSGARRMAYLHLLPLSAGDNELIDRMLTGSPAERLAATRQLVTTLRGALGPADHLAADKDRLEALRDQPR